MARENQKFVIIPTAEVENVDFSQVIQTSADSLRLSEDGDYTFVKFIGDTPSFLEGKTQYTYSEFINILNDTSGIWHIDDVEILTWTDEVKRYINHINWSSLNPFNWTK
tara:strand:- start:364 stop:690 length:327 start_codon:yes stop_codon:yes gene_type:complete